MQLCIGCLLASILAVQPPVDVNARPLSAVSYNGATSTVGTQERRTEDPASRTTPYRPARPNLLASSAAGIGEACKGDVHFPMRDGKDPGPLSERTHAVGTV